LNYSKTEKRPDVCYIGDLIGGKKRGFSPSFFLLVAPAIPDPPIRLFGSLFGSDTPWNCRKKEKRGTKSKVAVPKTEILEQSQ
jgi:hypothetical protein